MSVFGEASGPGDAISPGTEVVRLYAGHFSTEGWLSIDTLPGLPEGSLGWLRASGLVRDSSGQYHLAVPFETAVCDDLLLVSGSPTTGWTHSLVGYSYVNYAALSVTNRLQLAVVRLDTSGSRGTNSLYLRDLQVGSDEEVFSDPERPVHFPQFASDGVTTWLTWLTESRSGFEVWSKALSQDAAPIRHIGTRVISVSSTVVAGRPLWVVNRRSDVNAAVIEIRRANADGDPVTLATMKSPFRGDPGVVVRGERILDVIGPRLMIVRAGQRRLTSWRLSYSLVCE